MEELAAAYERRTSVLPVNMSRRISYFHNPHRYEHPEHHHKALKAKEKRSNSHNNKLHPISAIPERNELYDNGPITPTIPTISIHTEEEANAEQNTWAL